MTTSWDFYDTLVVRCVMTPSDIFEIIEEKLGFTGFAKARIAAEQRSRLGVAETSLERIYSELPYSTADKQQLITLEKNLEIALSSPIQENVTRLASPGPVISDMYLGEQVLRSIAKQCGFESSISQFFVSSDHAATKDSGELYKIAQQNLTLSRHVGDNAYSDVKMARKMGIQAEHYRSASPEVLESYWADSACDGKYFAGVLRATRLSNPATNIADKPFWNIHGQLVAPLLVEFVLWIFKDMDSRGIKDVYFLSRDGQIFYKIAQQLNRLRAAPLKCHYLYASRQALHLPGHDNIDQSCEWLLENTEILSLGLIAERAGISSEKLLDLAKPMLAVSLDQNLTSSQRQQLPELIHSQAFMSLLDAASDSAAIYATRYLRESGLIGSAETPKAIVDVGWNARLQRSIDNILIKSEQPFAHICGYYFGLSDHAVYPNGDRVKGFLYDPYRRNESDHSWVNKHAGMVEFFLRADHPSVIGYRADGVDGKGKIGPVFNPNNKSAAATELELDSIKRQHQAILCYVENYLKLTIALGRMLQDDNFIAVKQLAIFLDRPTFKQARGFSEFTTTEQQIGGHYVPLIKEVALLDTITNKNSTSFGIWPEASHRLSRTLWLWRLRQWLISLKNRLKKRRQ